MHRPIRAVLTVVVGLVLALTVSPAIAGPTPSPSPPASGPTVKPNNQGPSTGSTYTMKLSKGQSGFVRMASKTVKASTKKHHLNWRAAKKYFGKHTKSRDSFASGWLAGRGTLDHASASTIKRLKHYKHPAVVDGEGVPMRPAGGTNCQGVTKHVHVRDLIDDYYYDSCDTIDIVYWLTTCAKAAGALMALTGWKSKTAGGIFFLIASGCVGVADQVATARDKSSKAAFIWRTLGYHAYPNGQINTTYELIPQ